ncbi:deoxyribonuclease [Pseudoclavibacter sp. AY1F1]|uniref:HNH endonuclease family protein n=1 Tax=Pseudoclavibacter sp. AY1F1 TaxID=2080583 RepID=UPI000CE9244A|nr:HNH endonuclease family protein [Pseudoclavibacter sp. AY1F1]PPF47185.1 deoxyribonuclease [Pseudoclavibacter sp. AY1F1]
MSLFSTLRTATAGAFLALTASTAVASPAFAAPAATQAPITLDVAKSNVAPLIDAGFASQVDGAWYVDGAAVAAAAEGLRTVNSSATGYDRDLFKHWADPDGNGCDARNDMLQRDLTNVVLRDGSDCIVERGTLQDPYTGEAIPFTRGVATSGAVQIDHIIPLAAAWTGGANEWDATKREALANDPMNLQAVEGRANSAKGMRLASEWMPTNTAFHCTYLAQLTSVLKVYDLAVTPIDQDAIINGGIINGVSFAGVSSCALPAGAVVTDPSVTPSTTPIETVEVTPAPEATSTPAPVESETHAAAVAPAEAGHEAETGSSVLATTGDAALPWTLGLAGAALVALTALVLQHRRKA